MITYLYWLFTFALAAGALYLLGFKARNWSAGIGTGAVLLIVSFALFHFYFENIFVKRWGGKMSIEIPAGMHHISATWKDDNLCIENFEPKTN